MFGKPLVQALVHLITILGTDFPQLGVGRRTFEIGFLPVRLFKNR
jgi:hypothetical protein